MGNTHIYTGISFLLLGYPPQITSWVLQILPPLKRILRYLAYTPKFGLWYPRGSTFDLIGYSDAD